MEFELKGENEISLSSKIAATSLTLDEIGAIVCVMCAFRAQEEDDETIGNRLTTPDLKAAVKSLKEREILTVRVEGKTVELNFNLDAALPPTSQPSRPSRDTNPGA